MASILALLLLTLLPAAVGAAPVGDGAILDSSAYALAPWDSLERPQRYVTREDYERARTDRGLELRRIAYSSDGLRVTAIVAAPRPRPARPLPVVVFCRGGYVVGDVGWQSAPLFQHLVRAGFVVIAPMLRGSDGAEGHDEMGGADLADLRNTIPLATSLGIADTSRLFLCGESRGGAMVGLALRRGFPARAAATWGAFTDLDSLMDADPAVYSRVAPTVWPDFATRRATIVEERSSARWASEIGVPLLILHGGADRSVAVSHSVRLAERLEAAGREYRLIVAGGQVHTLRDATGQRDAWLVDWFRAHDRR